VHQFVAPERLSRAIFCQRCDANLHRGNLTLSIAIPLIPDPPAGLIDAAIRTTLVPFIGAGVSQLAGCPRWSEFADKVIDWLVAEHALDAAQRSQLGNLSPRVKLSVAKLAAQGKGIDIDYRGILQKTGEWKKNLDGRRIYSHISALASKFVTTNYDEWLDIVFPPELTPESIDTKDDRREEQRRNPLYLPSDIRADNFLTPNSVVHLHGALADPATMVLSTSDYIHRYANGGRREDGQEENNVLCFLEYLFREKTVLFIGYGLDELEILEYIIMKAKASARQSANVAGHYLLQGFFSFEDKICDSLHEYFLKECGIELIPFRRDENDWKQLIHVLEAFAKALPANDELIVQQLAEMEELARG